MAGFALILLPLLVSGFLFCLLFYPARFVTAKFDGQRLFFLAATLGLSISYLSSVLLPYTFSSVAAFTLFDVSSVERGLSSALPGANPLFALHTVLCSIAFAMFLNIPFWLSTAMSPTQPIKNGWHYTIELLTPRLGDPLQFFLMRAVTRQKKIQVCLQSGRVYIGFVFRMPPKPHVDTAYLELLTQYSLFRDEKGRFPARAEWNVYPGVRLAELKGYLGTLQDAINNLARDHELAADEKVKPRNMLEEKAAAARDALNGLEQFSPEDWIRVIPVSEIESVGYFDEAATSWFSADSVATEPAPGTP